MTRIGLIKEGKNPPDSRVPLTPQQCLELQSAHPDVKVLVQPSPTRCIADAEYEEAGIELREDLSDCDILLGVKEVNIEDLIPEKTYFFFSHTRKAQPYNKGLMQALIAKNIRMVDYECLTFADGQRILGFGTFAGIVGAHNGLMTYGKKWGKFDLKPAHELGTLAALKDSYKTLKLPPVRIVLTGSGKVANGCVEIMNALDIDYIEPEDFLENEYEYPVYTHLKGATLYQRKDGTAFHRNDFHHNPEAYDCVFKPYLSKADILMNGIYWDKKIPRLFEVEDIRDGDYKTFVISDITCDTGGSVPINLGSSTIADPVYGVDRKTNKKTAPFQNNEHSIDVMAVDNLPNELPRDASGHFGGLLLKNVLTEMLHPDKSEVLERATICEQGKLGSNFQHLNSYAFTL